MPSPDTILNHREAAAVAGVAPRLVAVWCDAGRLPCTVHGPELERRIRLGDLHEFLAARKNSR